ncbi:MAG: type II secretion system protein N [Pseudomonadota bacterium]
MKRLSPRWLVGTALATLFLATLVLSAPAYLVGYVLDERQIRLGGFSGTIWEGRASSAAIAVDDGWVQLGQLDWSLSQLYLLMLSPTADINAAWGQQRLRGNIQISPTGKLRLRGLDTTFSAALVKRLLPVSLRGRISLRARELVLEDGWPSSGAGEIVWQQAFWLGSRGAQPLGDYVLKFSIPGPRRAIGQLRTLSGDVRVEGEFALNGREYSLDTRIRNRGKMDQELANALALMAIPTADGYKLKFTAEI